ncbi:MAG TPA: di-trans,poly-cis-decaprenylcistransferase, partial [Euryarchaeota archaeon]|nr:di-trans,poly-cis-decaprenylcistransferase [Euryarchaeota archaeon]
IENAEESTKKYDGFLLQLAMAYGGREEVLDAVRRIAVDVKSGVIEPDSITEETIRKRLYTNGAPDPQLIIRTSGEERISNFLLWQSAYSELYFCETNWPMFRRIDFLRAIRTYQDRERRFGR